VASIPSDLPAEALRLTLVTSARHLPLRIRPAIPPSDDELFEMCQANRALRIERSAEGELLIMPPTGGATGNRNFVLTGQLAAWAAQDGSGIGFDSSTGFLLPNGAERSPDAAWVRRERWDALTSAERERFPPLCPDFVVELRSATDQVDELHAKLQEYLANGASLGWLIDPYTARVYVYRLGRPVEQLDAPEKVAGDPVLPGFTLRRDAIW
jgi:Uma2 family endonuclease